MAKETEEQKQERLNYERVVRLTFNLLGWLIRYPASLDALGFSEREKDVIQMKWKYGLTIEQIAGNLSLSKERARQIHDKLITKIYVRIPRVLTEYPDRKQLQQENMQLKQEIARYKAMLDSLSKEEKQELRKNDITDKKIDEIALRAKTINLLKGAGIKTVQDLLEFDTASLFAIKKFSVRMMVEVEDVLWQHHLRIKPG